MGRGEVGQDAEGEAGAGGTELEESARLLRSDQTPPSPSGLVLRGCTVAAFTKVRWMSRQGQLRLVVPSIQQAKETWELQESSLGTRTPACRQVTRFRRMCGCRCGRGGKRFRGRYQTQKEQEQLRGKVQKGVVKGEPGGNVAKNTRTGKGEGLGVWLWRQGIKAHCVSVEMTLQRRGSDDSARLRGRAQQDGHTQLQVIEYFLSASTFWSSPILTLGRWVLSDAQLGWEPEPQRSSAAKQGDAATSRALEFGPRALWWRVLEEEDRCPFRADPGRKCKHSPARPADEGAVEGAPHCD